MTNTIDFQQLFDQSYRAIYTELKTAYQEFKLDKTGLNELKIWNQFLSQITFVRDYELLCWKEPHVIDNDITATLLKNPFKTELKEAFEFKELEYESDCINNFVQYDIPKLRTKHLERLHSGHRDYEWDNEFIQNATSEDVIKLLAKYYAYTDFMNLTHPNYIKALKPQQRVDVDQKFAPCAKWNGKNVADFVQLMDSLYESGQIQALKGIGKTQMIEQLAQFFGIALAYGWERDFLADDEPRGTMSSPTWMGLRRVSE